MNWPKKLSAGLISLMMAVPSNVIGILAQEVEEEPITEEEIVEVVEETTIEEAPVEIPEEEVVVEEEEPVEEITEEVPEETVEIVEEVPAEDEEVVEVVEEETEVVELEEGEPEPEGEPEIKATGTQHIYITGDDWGAGVDKTVIKLDKTIDPASVAKEDFAVTQAVNGGDATARTVTAAYTSDAEGNAVTTASEYITIEMRISPTEGNPIVWSMQTWTNSWADPFELNVNLAEGATIVSGEEEITALEITSALNVKDINSADITVKQLDGYKFDTYTTVNEDNAGLTIPYGLYTPADDDHKNALVIWNHGVGERGSDPRIAILGNEVTALNSEKFQDVFDGAYVLVPQTPTNTAGKNIVKGKIELIEKIVAENPDIDPDRVIVGGCSMGGGQTMDIIYSRPDIFAAAYPVCPASTSSQVTDAQIQNIASLPIWFIHCTADDTVNYEQTTKALIERLEAAGNKNVHASLFEDVHDTTGRFDDLNEGKPYQYATHWSWVYFDNDECNDGDLNCWEWLAAQKRNIAEGTQTVTLIGDDWGAGITKTVLSLDKEIDALDKTYGAEDAPDFFVSQTTYNNELQARTITAAYTSDAEGNKSGASKFVTIEMRITPAEGNPILWDGSAWANNWANPFEMKVALAGGSSVTSGGAALTGLKIESAIEMPLGENVEIPQLEGYEFETYTTVNEDNAGLTIPYGLYTPADDDHKNALVIWNHGVGERGTDPRIAILGNEVTALNSEKFQDVFDGAYVLVPQTPTNTGGKDIVKGKIELIEKIVAENPDIDPDRVIVGGCSMGGGQTMDIIYSRPDIFAAAYPVCPASTSSQVSDEKIKNISGLPIWFIHCTADDTVNYEQTTKALIERLKAAGSNTVHASLFEDVHDTTGRFDDLNEGKPYQYATHWSWVYFDNDECNEGDLNCWEWLAKQNRQNNCKPGVEVDGDEVTFVYKDTNEKDAVKVTFTGNFQWFKWEEVGDFQAMGDNSGIPCYDADHYEEGMFNASGGLNNDTPVYELEEVDDEVFTFSFKLPGNLYFYDYTVEYADGTTVTMKDPGNMPKKNPATGSDAGHSLFYVGDAENTTKGQEYIYERTDDKKGTYTFVPYTAIDGTEQYIGIYLPYGYDESKTYKTVYISHGGGGNEEEWMSIGAVPNILDNLIADGEVEPTIAVTMNNTYFNWDYAKVLPNVVDYIIPCVEENFAVSTEANDRAFCGLSMGSMTTNEMAKTYPNEFGYFGSFSGGSQDLDKTKYDVAALNSSVLYLTAGAVDMAYNNKMGIASVDYMKMYDELGVNYTFDLLGGAHDWGVWRESFTIFAKDYLWTPIPVEAQFAGIVTDAGEYVDYMCVDFGDAEISGVDNDTFKVMMTATVDYGEAKGQPYAYYDATKPLKVVKTEVEGGLVKVYFQQDQAPVLTWLAEGRNYPAILGFTITQEKPITVTVDGVAQECTGKYFSVAKSWKDLKNEELEKFEDVQDEINYQFHKGSNDKLIVFFHGNGEGDFPVKDTNNNVAQILANRGGVAWVSEEAQEVFGDASVMAFQAPNMWYFAIKDNLLEPCYNEIQKVIEENNIDPDEVYLSGASAGGFMSTRMIIAYPDLFKAAMINCPALDAANARSGSDDAIPTDEELAKLLDSKTAIWLVQGETDSSVDPELCSKRIWNIITEGEEISEKEYEGDKGIASAFTTYETADGKYKLSLYKTYDLGDVTGISGEVRKGGKLLFAEDYDQDGVYTEVKYSDHWSWIYTLRDNPEAADGTHIWEWAVAYTDKEIVSGTQTVHVVGDDWGPAVDKVTIALEKEVNAADLKAEEFTVVEKKEAFDWGAFKPTTAVTEREVLDVYLSDEEGKPINATSGKIITVDMYVSPNDGSPFYYDVFTGFNRWVDEYNLNVRGYVGDVKVKSVQDIDFYDNDMWTSELADKFNQAEFKGPNNTLVYGEFVPEKEGKKPLFIWLHGAGEGTNNGKNDNYIDLLGNEVTAFVTDEFQGLYENGVYVVTPQAPTVWMDDGTGAYITEEAGNAGQTRYDEDLFAFIEDYVAKHEDIDPERVIIGGCSNGGYMTVNMILKHPDYFYKAFPICEAYYDSAIKDEEIKALAEGGTGIWFTFADADTTVDPTKTSIPTYNRLKEAGADVHKSQWADVHDTTGRFKDEEGNPYVYAGHWSWIYFDNNSNVCDDHQENEWEWLAEPKTVFEFDDVKDPEKSFYEPVYWAYKNGITTGTSTEPPLFSPFDTCTRAQFVTFLWRQQGKPEPTLTESPFKDVQNKELSYYKAVLWAVENEITTGTSPTTFDPGKKVTRAQAVTFLWRANNKPAPKTTVNPFKDVAAGLSYSDAVLWAYENGITTGTSATTFNPGGDCTRGATVTFLWRTYAKN